ncbi:MAG: MoxR family ATPase [Proteobacteria bacterium]|nr:MoxR family ATPase [Pseudomonadota bacterium]
MNNRKGVENRVSRRDEIPVKNVTEASEQESDSESTDNLRAKQEETADIGTKTQAETESSSSGSHSRELSDDTVRECSEKIQKVFTAIDQGLVGQKKVAERLFMALLARGHVLLEGLPGLAKTTAIKILGTLCHLDFNRIQFTPDLLPADITGTEIFIHETSEFRIKKGPVFCHLLLADEINRAPSKVQAALLEVMQEKQVTISGQEFKLDSPFLVLATQNPIDQEGTYTLPEAQLDRFLFKLNMTYGTLDDEVNIMKRVAQGIWQNIKPVIERQEIEELSSVATEIFVSDDIRRYIASLVFATRFPENFALAELKPWILCGASPRASIALEQTAKIQALFMGRSFVTPSDVKEMAYDVLNHRIVLSFEAEAEEMTVADITSKILATVPVP